MHYNFVHIHQTLRCTPAMAAGVSETLWEVAGMVRGAGGVGSVAGMMSAESFRQESTNWTP